MLVVDPDVVGEDDPLLGDDVGVGGLEPRSRAVVPLTVLDRTAADAEVVRLLLGVERRPAAEPLVASIGVGECVPDAVERRVEVAFDYEGGVELSSFADLVHGRSPCRGGASVPARNASSRSSCCSAGSCCRLIHCVAAASAAGRELDGAHAADFRCGHDAGRLEHADVLSRTLQGHRERFSQLADRSGAACSGAPPSPGGCRPPRRGRRFS